jgi:succinate dehydrogenase / fumarate reductase cytochrome b subunit
MASRLITFWDSSIGKKTVMAITGLIGFGFSLGHMSGHLITFRGPEAYNAYAHFLQQTKPLLWGTRIVLLLSVILHAQAAFTLWSRNHSARPRRYKQRKDIATNYAARTMRYGGVFLLLFLAYHIAHFTLGATSRLDGVPFQASNPYNNVVFSFQQPVIAGLYIAAMVVLGFHLYHGVWSLMQSLGLEHPRFNRFRREVAIVGTLLVVIGFIIVPVAVQAGLLKPAPATAAAAAAPAPAGH